jgi:pSer/pThr/pTyr-binding forkhead associated (FHA) protein
MPELILKLGDSVLQTYVFDKDIMSVGRSRDNDVVIENLSVSRNHARIRRQGGKYILTDLNSANGTFVNGVRVSKTEIVDDDLISIGKHKLSFSNKVVPEEQLIVDAFGADRTVLVERAAPAGMICITDGKLKGQQFLLHKSETTIGKSSNNDVVLSDDWFLGKRQAVIIRRDDLYELNDLGSFRKTRINGEPVTGPAKLKPGDTVEFGNTKCVFQMSNDANGEQATGRVPQELGLEDSIFSTGISELQVIEFLEPEPAEPEEKSPAAVSVSDVPAASVTPESESLGLDLPEPMSPHSQPTPVVFSEPQVVAASISDEPATKPRIQLNQLDSDPGANLEPHTHVAAAARSTNSGGSSGSGKKKKKKRSNDVGLVTERFGSGMSAPESPSDDSDSKLNASDAPAGDGWHDGFDSDKIASIPLLQSENGQAQANAVMDTAEPSSQAMSGSSAKASHEVKTEPLSPWHLPNEQNESAEVLHDSDQLANEVALWENALNNKSPVIRKQAARMLKKLTGKDYAY